MLFGCIIIVAFFSSDVAVARKLPPFITPCHRNDVDLNQCMKNAAEELRPYLSDGIPEMHVPKMEPLYIQSAQLDTGPSFKAFFEDIYIYNTTDFNLKDIDLKLEENRVNISLGLGQVRAIGHYRVKGRILILQLDGSGKAEINLTDVSGVARLKGRREMIKGKEHLIFDKVKVDVKFGGGGELYFDDLFRDNQELTEQTNKILNQNLESILIEFKPVLDDIIGDIAGQLVHGIFRRYSVDELFPKA